VGSVLIGGNAPISVQTMTTTDTRDVRATLEQILQVDDAGCDIVRVAVPSAEAAASLERIVSASPLPVVADVHFDYRLALSAIRAGVHKLRINPGNIGGPDRVKAIVKAAQAAGIPIRVGVNAGSLEKHLEEKYQGAPAEAMVASALRHVRLLENLGFMDIVISLKSSSVPTTIAAYHRLIREVDYPLHVGLTEAGTEWSGTIKSAVGIGSLLAAGIGDTIRVSLTADPVKEVRAGEEILKSLGLRRAGVEIISCPTCGRCQIDLVDIVRRVEAELADVKVPLRVAIMGCVVNGPGEARDADIGVAGGKECGMLFKHGQPVRKVAADSMVKELVSEARHMAEETQSRGTPGDN